MSKLVRPSVYGKNEWMIGWIDRHNPIKLRGKTIKNLKNHSEIDLVQYNFSKIINYMHIF